VSDTLRIAQTGSGLRMTNVGAFDNDGSDNFRIYGTNSLYLRANGENGGGLSIDSTNQDVTIDNDLRVSAGQFYYGGTAVTSTATELNLLDGVTGITLGSANELLIVGSDGTSIISDSTLSIDTGSNYIGINQSSPEVTLHMTGEGAQTAQIRMEQYNDSADAPDVRTRRYRGTIASPSAIQSGDYLFRSNHEYYNGSALIVGGQFAFDNTNNANRTQFTVAVTTDGTSVEASSNDDVQFKIDGNDSGAITFNNAYKFPTTDGSANQFLQTDGGGAITFASATVSDISDLTANATELNLLDGVTGPLVTEAESQTLTNKTLGATTISGHLTPSANVTYDLGTSSNRFRDIYLAGNTVDIGGTKLSKDDNGDLDIKDASDVRKTIKAAAIELFDTDGKAIKIERDATTGKMKTRKFGSDGSEEASQDVIDISEDLSPKLGGDLDANGNKIDMGSNTITDTKVGQWDTAYSWGDHSTQSYLSGDVGFPTDLGLITGSASTFPIGTNSDFGALTGDTFVGLGLEDLGVIRQEVTATSTDTLSNKTLSAPSVTGAIELAVTSDPSIVTDKAYVYAKDADAEAVTNLLTHSEQFDNSAWVDATLSALSTVTANDGTDPLGGSTADRISGGTGGSMRAQQTGVSYTNGTTYTFSVYIKGTSGQTVGVGRYNPTQDGDVTVTTHTLDGTWQRLSHTFTATATNSGGRVVISGNGDKSQTATDFLVWGAQLEAGASSPGVYVQTTTASATGYEQKAEVYVKDESGNVTKISPHNQQGEWEYYSRNVMTGKVVRINMEEMIRDIESLTGKSYIKHE
jgi:hypothetical protein